MPTRGKRPGSKPRSTFPDTGKRGPDMRWYDPDLRSVHPGQAQARYLFQRERARAKALLPPPEPFIRERICRICQRVITRGFKRQFCAACRATLNSGFNRRLVSSRRATGLCVRCGAAAIQGQSNCARCRDKARQRYTPTMARAARKRRVADRKARHVCTVCEAAVASGRLRCLGCLRDSQTRHLRERASWRAAGLCSGCGRTPKRGTLCGVCAERKKKLRSTNRSEGFCRCGRFRAPARKSCLICLTAAREYQRRRVAAKARDHE